MDELVSFIKESHPGTFVYNVDAFNNEVNLLLFLRVFSKMVIYFFLQDSFVNMWLQVHGVQEKVGPVIANATDGVNLICYSQGVEARTHTHTHTHHFSNSVDLCMRYLQHKNQLILFVCCT